MDGELLRRAFARRDAYDADGVCGGCGGRGRTGMWPDVALCRRCNGEGHFELTNDESVAAVAEIRLLRRVIADLDEDGRAASLALRYRKVLGQVAALGDVEWSRDASAVQAAVEAAAAALEGGA